ncbi:hypothetical protein [Agrobacterium tumefaciens]|uniref:hypothetical protein n=1 Tax=Agrobacterium tumefaciens complex TaxID=1183400 RepID=UPI0012966C99|nr:hypothetical protein [Agrobacterium tumefaciens]MCW8056532.1 hypothetical protein [Agrobacterium tumefaciens]MCW8144339.1 hypothetical protein [Agrobacterium tumefaciens]MQB35965.1 hypothetical protein [Agrobacterium tumefaciens]NTA47167.1 hypothetical protein [Agrobacterium tumefaciens]
MPNALLDNIPQPLLYVIGVLLALCLIGSLLNHIGRLCFGRQNSVAFVVSRLIGEVRELEKMRGKPSRRFRIIESGFWAIFCHGLWIYLSVVLTCMLVIAVISDKPGVPHLKFLAGAYFLFGCLVAGVIRLGACRDWRRFRALLGGEEDDDGATA